MRMNETVLYGKGAYGTNIWTIWSEENVIHILANGGRYTEVIKEGKAGRSIVDQVKLRIDARVRSKLDSGFKRTKEELNGIITNQLGLAAPMLATPLKNVRNLKTNECYVQPKLDGHRCLINADGAYSRRGKVIETIPEIIASLDIPEGVTLDGELYCHGVPLQTVASWAKRRQADTLKLQFHVYDLIVEDLSFGERLELINKIVNNGEFTRIVDTVKFNNEHSIFDYYHYYRDSGYEGAILRPESSRYEIGKRSKQLIKVKMRYDEEFKCVDIEPSREGLGILILQTKEGNRFKTLAPGDNITKRNTLQNKEKYIGRYVTCEFAELTKDKIPFHCVAIRWRIDV